MTDEIRVYSQTLTRNNETEILRRTVEALLAMPGHEDVHLCYDFDRKTALVVTRETPFEQVVQEAFACGSCTLRVGSKWVSLIWHNGNYGLDAITDYTSPLKEILDPVFDWIEFRDGMSPNMMRFFDVTEKLIADLIDHEGAEGFSDSTHALYDQYEDARKAVSGGAA